MSTKTVPLILLAALSLPSLAQAETPEWCVNYKPKKNQDESAASEGRGERPVDVFRYAGWVCQFPNNPKVPKAFEAVKGFYMKWSGATEEEVKQMVMIAVTSDDIDRDLDKLPARKPNTKSRVADEMDNLVNYLFPPDQPLNTPVLWSLDVGAAPPSQLALVHLMTTAMAKGKSVRDIGYFIAAMDADKLDRKAFDAEVEALGVNPAIRAALLGRFFRVGHLLEKAKASLEKRAETDKVMKALLETPAKAKAEWQKIYDANKDDIDAAQAMAKRIAYDLPIDDIKKPNKIGCDDIRKRFRTYGASRKPKTAEDFETLVHNDPVAYQLLESSALCDAAEQRLYDAKVAAAVLRNENNRSFAGPRMHMLSLAYDIANAAAAEAQKSKQPPTVYPSEFVLQLPPMAAIDRAITAGDYIRMTSAVYERKELMGQPGNKKTTVEGRIKSVKKTADGSVVSFKAEKWQAPTEKCTPTGRIAFWAGNYPNPEYHCVVVGYHEESFTQNDVMCRGDLAGSLKPDQWARVLVQDTSKDPGGAVILVGKRAGKSVTWTSFLGVPLAGK